MDNTKDKVIENKVIEHFREIIDDNVYLRIIIDCELEEFVIKAAIKALEMAEL